MSETPPPTFNVDQILKDYKAADRRLLIFDYDGTLTPIVPDPLLAIPSPALVKHLQRLSEEPKNDVWIISGRDRHFLHLNIARKVPKANFVAEHGCWLNRAQPTNQTCRWDSLIDPANQGRDTKERVAGWFTFLKNYFPGTKCEEKDYSVTWHYRELPETLAIREKIEFAAAASRHLVAYDKNVEILHGKKILEMRPCAGNKASSVELALQGGPYQFIWCAGDDKTDEDMFLHLANQPMDKPKPEPTCLHTCHVGDLSEESTAEFKVVSPDSMVWVVEHMVMADKKDDEEEEQPARPVGEIGRLVETATRLVEQSKPPEEASHRYDLSTWAIKAPVNKSSEH